MSNINLNDVCLWMFNNGHGEIWLEMEKELEEEEE